jgi:UDP-N-acetyl-D-mannosaminuronic acid dehydrogenase
MIDKGKVCVVGTGHIGLPLAAVLAEAGFEVTGYDTNDNFVSRVNTSGAADFREDGLDEFLERHLHKTLTLTSSPPAGHDVYIITVGTPLERGTQRPGLDRIRVLVQRIAPAFGPDPLVILRSTVSIGTTRNIVLPEIRRHAKRFALPSVRSGPSRARRSRRCDPCHRSSAGSTTRAPIGPRRSSG